MRNRFLPGLIVLPVLFLWFSCAGSPRQESPAGLPAADTVRAVPEETSVQQSQAADEIDQEELPPAVPAAVVLHDLAFLPEDFTVAVPPGVGIITRNSKNLASSLGEKEKDALSGAFLDAYIDALLRGLPLTGVLGGDFVHGWPDNSPLCWAQNWSSSEAAKNSWGIPSLVLAVKGIPRGTQTGEKPDQGRVFIVRGKLLDYYGRSAGIKGANGSVGYGCPRGNEFLHQGKLTQRFALGLITVDEEGKGTFLPEDPPSSAIDPPPDLGVFTNVQGGVPDAFLEDVRAAFLAAWKMALDQDIKAMTSDGPGQYLSFSELPPDFPGGELLKGLYVQSFNQRSILLVLPDSSLITGTPLPAATTQPAASLPAAARLPLYPRLITPPFTEVLLDAMSSLPGGENLHPMNIKFSGGDDFSRTLMRGLSLYGIPLTDPVLMKFTAAAEDSPARWQLGQRFSRGWIVTP